MNKPKPKYNKIPFTEWLEKHTDLNFLIGNRILLAIDGRVLELVIEDIANVPEKFRLTNLSEITFLADDGQWRRMLAENIWYILKEIEYDKDPPVKQNEDIITTEYIKKLAEEWKKNKWNPNPHPPVEPIRPWYPSQPYHPNCPGYPAYPGWKPEVWCSTSTIFREDT